MSEFQAYISLGFGHILDFEGYDHMIFLMVLIAPIPLKNWKKLIILVTAFTLGHSISLAVSVFEWFEYSTELIELFIPITILCTSVLNISVNQNLIGKWHYFLAVTFGLIHGLGFSGYLKSLLGQGSEVVLPLLSFNLGIEIGQLLFVAFLVLLIHILGIIFTINQKSINLYFSGISTGISLLLILERV